MLALIGPFEPIAPKYFELPGPPVVVSQVLRLLRSPFWGFSVRQLVPNTPGIGKNGRLEEIRACTRRVATTVPLLSSKFPSAVTQRSWMTRLGRTVPPGG